MKVTIKYDRQGNVKKITGDVGRTRMNRAAYKLWRGEIEPSFGYKVRRFFRRAWWEYLDRLNAVTDSIVGSAEAAEDVPVIGLLEDYNGRHYDYKMQ